MTANNMVAAVIKTPLVVVASVVLFEDSPSIDVAAVEVPVVVTVTASVVPVEVSQVDDESVVAPN